MKISDAILLGSTMIKPLAGVNLNLEKTEGCAWGMANIAVGSGRPYSKLLRMASNLSVTMPCGCTSDWVMGSGLEQALRESMDNLASIIIHLFNDHVMTRKDWTLEHLVDWVRSVEPAEIEEKELETAELQEEKIDVCAL